MLTSCITIRLCVPLLYYSTHFSSYVLLANLVLFTRPLLIHELPTLTPPFYLRFFFPDTFFHLDYIAYPLYSYLCLIQPTYYFSFVHLLLFALHLCSHLHMKHHQYVISPPCIIHIGYLCNPYLSSLLFSGLSSLTHILFLSQHFYRTNLSYTFWRMCISFISINTSIFHT